MSLLESVLLGLLQGAAEFIPVSSSGHLAVLRRLLGLGGVPILYDILLHVATLLVVLFVFRRRVAALLFSLLHGLLHLGRRAAAGGSGSRVGPSSTLTAEDRENLRLILFLLVVTAITAAAGLGLGPLEEFFLGHPRLIGFLFLATALVLFLTRGLRGRKGYESAGLARAAAIGLAQGIGVLPGVSRSGVTISAALFCGLDREKAGELSFLASVPAVLGALILKSRETGELLSRVSLPVLAAGFCASLLMGLLSICILLRMVRQGRLHLFGFYLVPAGLLTLILG